MELSSLHNHIQKLDNFRLRLHFKVVDQRLRFRDVSHLSKPARQAWEEHLAHLRVYGERGIFPRNETHPDFRPCFIDRAGRECAVAHLLIGTGEGKFAQHIVETNNPAFVREMFYPEIEVWGGEAGFTKEELQIIQPAYPPSPDEMTLIRLMQLSVHLSGMVILLGVAGFSAMMWAMLSPMTNQREVMLQPVPDFLQLVRQKIVLWQNEIFFLLILSGLGILGLSASIKSFPLSMEYSQWSDFQNPMFLSNLAGFTNELNLIGFIQIIISLVFWGFLQLQSRNQLSLSWKIVRYTSLLMPGVGLWWMAMNYLAVSEMYNLFLDGGWMLFSRTLVKYCLENPTNLMCP